MVVPIIDQVVENVNEIIPIVDNTLSEKKSHLSGGDLAIDAISDSIEGEHDFSN